jgi:hypothetical protein
MFVAGKKVARVLALGIMIMGATTIMGAPIGTHTMAEAAALPAAQAPEVEAAPVAELSPGLSFTKVAEPVELPAQVVVTGVVTPTLAGVVTLTNSGTAVLTIASIAIRGDNPGDFDILTTSCGATLDPGASCAIDVVFNPTAIDVPRSATLAVADNAASSPQTVPLAGISV